MQGILEFILTIIMESIFGKIIIYFFKLVQKIGFYAVKFISFSSQPIEHFTKKYKDSSIPWFLGFGIVAFISYLLS